MSIIHLECKPDEKLAMKLGITRKQIEHHNGKSRVYAALEKNKNQIGIVDEDPDPNPDHPKYSYENNLVLIEEQYGIKRFFDEKQGNTVLVLKVKLEDWLISVCKNSKINMTKPPYSLPNKGNSLHNVINDRLPAYEKLLDDLLTKKSIPLLTLKAWLMPKKNSSKKV